MADRFLSPEEDKEVKSILGAFNEILPIEPGKCACALATRNAERMLTLLMETISASPGYILYQAHIDDDLEEIEHDIKEMDKHCELGGILSPLYDTKTQVKKLIENKILWNDDIQKVLKEEPPMAQVNQIPAVKELGKEVWNFVSNEIEQRLRWLLVDCPSKEK